jgi:hypothetical protein
MPIIIGTATIAYILTVEDGVAEKKLSTLEADVDVHCTAKAASAG